MAELVYKVSEYAGVTFFEPRPFWQLDDFARSGSAADPARIPPGASVFHCVYATRESFVPFYFAPRHCPRFSIDAWANQPCLSIVERWFGLPPRESSRLIVFREADRDALARAEFSVYAFDARQFRMLPTRELVADRAVAPVREVRHANALSAVEACGWSVQFVPDLDALRRLRDEIRAVGVTRFSTEKM